MFSRKNPWFDMQYQEFPVTLFGEKPENLTRKASAHTMVLLTQHTFRDARQLDRDIVNSGLFQYASYPIEQKGSCYTKFIPTKNGPNGMHFILRTSKFVVRKSGCKNRDDELTCSLKVVINPKLLSGDSDYVGVASREDILKMIDRFNDICHMISPLLHDIGWYRFDRVDACSNIVLHDIPEIVDIEKRWLRPVIPEMIIRLIRMGDIPLHYTRYEPEDDSKKTFSCYMKCQSANINFYCKYAEMKEKFPDLGRVECARDIVRLEIQVKNKKLNATMNSFDRMFENAMLELCSEQWCVDAINGYWQKIVGRGDWYRYRDAVKKLNGMNIRIDTKNRLVGVLNKVRMSGSVYDAKKYCFDRLSRSQLVDGINDLNEIGINPVCIPDDWGIEWIPNVWERWKMMDVEVAACG